MPSFPRPQNSRVFFSKSVKKSVKRGVRVLRARSAQSRSLFSASFQTFCLTARAYLKTQKYGLFCSLLLQTKDIMCTSEQALLFGRAKREHESGARLLFTIYPKWRACSQATPGKDIYVRNNVALYHLFAKVNY